MSTVIKNAVTNAGGNPIMMQGLDAAKPVAGIAGRLYVATDTLLIYRDNGSVWQELNEVDLSGYVSKWEAWNALLTVNAQVGGTYTMLIQGLLKEAYLAILSNSLTSTHFISRFIMTQYNLSGSGVYQSNRILLQSYRQNSSGVLQRNDVNDEIGLLYFRARNFDNANFNTCGGIACQTPDGTKVFLFFGASNLTGSYITNPAYKMGLSGDGNLIISPTLYATDTGERLQVDGTAKATSFVKNAGTAIQSLQADGTVKTLDSGVYTPNLTPSSNCAAVALVSASYSRVGNVVTASILMDVTPTIGGLNTGVQAISLPVSFGTSYNRYQATGVAYDKITQAVVPVSGFNSGSSSTTIFFVPAANNVQSVSIQIMYSGTP